MKRPIRIGGRFAALTLSLFDQPSTPGASGAASDRRVGFSQLAAAYPDDPVDVLIGDFMSEGNMTTLAAKKADSVEGGAFESGFLQAIPLALQDIAKYGIKVTSIFSW
jgi:hypothetical protein